MAELFLPLVTGGVVVLRDRRLLQDPHGLVKVIRDHGVTMFQTVPSVWLVMLSEIPDFPRIRVIATTGEAAPNDLARRLVDVADEVWNLYGSTETTVWGTGHLLQRNGTVSLSAAAPIGRPLANMEARVLDEYRMRVPADGPSANGAPERLGARIKRHVKHLAANPRHALSYIVPRELDLIPRPVVEWISYHLVHFYGRHPNPISACLLPKNRWPAFWYTTQRLARTYNPQPCDGEVLAMFISHQERRAMWQKLLGPTADIRIIDCEHFPMFTEPALSLWLQPLRAYLEGES